jgi:hypothetical protein
MTIILSIGIFGLAIMGLSIGVIIANSPLRGSCGGSEHLDLDGCGSCSKKEAEICPTDTPMVAIAQLAYPNPKHHR